MNLSRLRKEIDRIDTRLLALLNRRASVARQIGDLKRRQGLPIFDGKREAAVLQRLARSSDGALPAAAIRAIFQVILRHNRRLQGRVRPKG